MTCQCIKCLDDGWTKADQARWQFCIPPSRRRMVVCQTCGNKRCPHATDHRLDCTDSNEPGQKGSVYA